jgi:hypothetical protein
MDISTLSQSNDVDTMLNEYLNNMKKSYNLFLSDPNKYVSSIWTHDSHLYKDENCGFLMGADLKNNFICYNCKNFKRLVNFKLGGIYEPIKIEYGENLGKSIIVNKNDVQNVFLSWDQETSDKARIYLYRYHWLESCGSPDISNMICLRGDPFTSRIIINMLVNDIFTKENLPHSLKLYTSFICGESGYTVFEYPESIKTFDALIIDIINEQKKIPVSIAKNIILQLCVILRSLSKYDFAHGTPSYKSLFFKNEKCKYEYDNAKIESQITMMFSNFWYSSILINNNPNQKIKINYDKPIHISSKTVKSDLYLQKALFTPEINVKSIDSQYCDENNNKPKICNLLNGKSNYYKLGNDTVNVYAYIRHAGFPLFINSFDFYCFFTSMMCNKHFFNSIYSDENLYKIWTLIWTKEDFIQLENRIRSYHTLDLNSLKEDFVFDVIKNCWLKCNVLDDLWNEIVTL